MYLFYEQVYYRQVHCTRFAFIHNGGDGALNRSIIIHTDKLKQTKQDE